MNKMNIKDANNQMIEVFLVRYFKYKNTNYLIYTLNEVDEKGFIKLYLVKIMKQFNEWIAKTIKDDEEWKRMQLIVKNILKEIKSGNIESFNDLDISDIQNIKVKEARYFKLDENLMKLLSNNIQHQEIENIDFNQLPNMDEIAPVNVEIKEQTLEEPDYKSLYMEIKKDNDELNETMSDMLMELAEYRAKYGKLEGR